MSMLSRFAATGAEPIAGGFTSFWNGGGSATFSLVVPSDVYTIAALAIGASGGGGGASSAATASAGGGGGGGLSYGNIPVTPGETLSVFVGTYGLEGSAAGTAGGTGQNVYIRRGATDLILAIGGGGGGGATGGSSGTAGAGGAAASGVGDVRMSGGAGGAGNANDRGGGGGGNAGYSGAGGRGGFGTTVPTSVAGGGGGGGYFGFDGAALVIAGAGGGTMIYGAGASGAAGTAGSRNGQLGSSLGGSLGQTHFLGGGGGGSSNGVGMAGGRGTGGLVRILWGNNASFPSTNVLNSIPRLVASAASSTATITVPDGVRPGDLLVLFDYARSATTPTRATLTGFFSPSGGSVETNATSLTRCLYRTVLSEAESATTLTCSTGTLEMQKILLVIRSTGGCSIIGSASGNYPAGTVVLDSASAITETVADASRESFTEGMALNFAFFRGTSGITPSTDITFSGASFVQGTSNVYQVAYKFYDQSTTSYSDAISMTDRGTNTLLPTTISVW